MLRAESGMYRLVTSDPIITTRRHEEHARVVHATAKDRDVPLSNRVRVLDQLDQLLATWFVAPPGGCVLAGAEFSQPLGQGRAVGLEPLTGAGGQHRGVGSRSLPAGGDDGLEQREGIRQP